MEDEFIQDIKSQEKLRLTQLQMTQDDSVQMKKSKEEHTSTTLQKKTFHWTAHHIKS